MKPALLCWLIPPAVARHLAALDLSLVPVAPATDLTAESAEQEEDRSNDQQDKTDRPERRDTEDESDDQQDQPQDNHVAPPGSGGCPAQSAGTLPSRTPSKT